jgi:hypothetical protein
VELPGHGGLWNADGELGEEVVAGEAGVAIVAVGIEDPKLCPPSRRAEPVAGDHRLRPLPNDVATQPDPRSPGQLEPKPGRFRDGAGHPGRQARWLDEDEQRLRPARQRDQPMEAIAKLRRASGSFEARREIEDEQVDGPTGEQRRRDRQALVEARRRDDDEPLEADPAGHRLDRVECPAHVQPGGDRSRGLRLRDGPQRERRHPARAGPAKGDAGRSRQAAGTQDGVECREAGRDDTAGQGRAGKRPFLDDLRRQRRRRQRPHDLADIGVARHPRGGSWSCRAPARLEGRESGRHVWGERRHETRIVEQVFDLVNGRGSPRRHCVLDFLPRSGPFAPVSRGDVAQLEEHRVRIAGVRGSSPLISTKPQAAWVETPSQPLTIRRRLQSGFAPIRHVRDQDVLPSQQPIPNASGVFVVEVLLPPVPRHVLGEEDHHYLLV